MTGGSTPPNARSGSNRNPYYRPGGGGGRRGVQPWNNRGPSSQNSQRRFRGPANNSGRYGGQQPGNQRYRGGSYPRSGNWRAGSPRGAERNDGGSGWLPARYQTKPYQHGVNGAPGSRRGPGSPKTGGHTPSSGASLPRDRRDGPGSASKRRPYSPPRGYTSDSARAGSGAGPSLSAHGSRARIPSQPPTRPGDKGVGGPHSGRHAGAGRGPRSGGQGEPGGQRARSAYNPAGGHHAGRLPQHSFNMGRPNAKPDAGGGPSVFSRMPLPGRGGGRPMHRPASPPRVVGPPGYRSSKFRDDADGRYQPKPEPSRRYYADRDAPVHADAMKNVSMHPDARAADAGAGPSKMANVKHARQSAPLRALSSPVVGSFRRLGISPPGTPRVFRPTAADVAATIRPNADMVPNNAVSRVDKVIPSATMKSSPRASQPPSPPGRLQPSPRATEPAANSPMAPMASESKQVLSPVLKFRSLPAPKVPSSKPAVQPLPSFERRAALVPKAGSSQPAAPPSSGSEKRAAPAPKVPLSQPLVQPSFTSAPKVPLSKPAMGPPPGNERRAPKVPLSRPAIEPLPRPPKVPLSRPAGESLHGGGTNSAPKSTAEQPTASGTKSSPRSSRPAEKPASVPKLPLSQPAVQSVPKRERKTPKVPLSKPAVPSAMSTPISSPLTSPKRSAAPPPPDPPVLKVDPTEGTTKSPKSPKSPKPQAPSPVRKRRPKSPKRKSPKPKSPRAKTVPDKQSPAPMPQSPTPLFKSIIIPPKEEETEEEPTCTEPLALLVPSPHEAKSMAEIDANIAVMRKKIAAQKALIFGITPEATLRDIANEKPKASTNGMSLDDEKMCIFKRKAQAIVFAAQQRMEPEPPVDFVASVDNGLARLINRDRAKARKAVDDLRHLCHDPEKGLDCIEKAADSMILPVSDETLQSVRDFVSKKKLEDSQRRRMLRKEYRYLEETWKKRLKSARDKRSKEKREANRDRDRYLLVQTRGPAGLLTCKTSSGRTSHKIMPVTPGGVMNNVAEVDSILADIEQAGGTPGSHHIWMKTLAQIPDQDPSKVPYDSGMLLIDDPIAEVYAARCVNPWTREEKLIFLEKYLLYQKNFHKIAGFLDYKDTGDCVRFYFDHKLKYNLKQLLRESGSMKRKGIRTQHLLMLAGLPSTRQALTRGIVDPHRAEGDRALESGTGVIDAAASPYEPTTAPETPNNDTDPGVGPMLDPEPGSVEHHANGLAPMNSVVFKLESEQIDLSAAERAVFSNALVKYGKNWKVIADEHGFFGGNVGQLITYFNRNKERYNFVSSIEKHALAEGVAREDAAAKSERGNAERDSLKFRIHEKGSPDQRSRTERPHPRPHASPRRSSDGADEPRKATWTQDEMATVEQHFRDYGKDWKKISKLMGQKTPQQVKGYWKKQNPQERDSSGSKKKRHRVKSNQSSPLLVKSGSMRNGIPASAKEEKTELAREHSRKRDADDAKLADQRSRGEKRERLGNDAESPRGARKEVVDGGTPVPRKLASPKSPKVAEPSGSPRLPMRFPLRSKPAPEVGSVKPASKASVDEGKECAGSPS